MKIPNLFGKIDFTRGSIIKNTFRATTPLWVGTTVFIFVHLLNTYWISRLGSEAIAAVIVGGAVFMMLIVPIQEGLVTTSFAIIGASAKGEKKDNLNRLIQEILILAFILSLSLALIGFFLAPILVNLLGAKGEVAVLAADYARVQAIGGIISFSFWVINGIIRSNGDFFSPMVLICGVLILQAIFDPFFILGLAGFPKMGVAGAAFSLALSAILGTVGGLWVLSKKNLFKRLEESKIRVETLKDISRIAGPGSLEGFARVAGESIILRIVASFGVPALAAYGIGFRFFRMSQVASWDLGTTTIAGVADNLGAGKIQRAKKTAWVVCGINTLLMLAVGSVLFFFAGHIAQTFTSDPEILKITISYFKITAFAYLFVSAATILRKAFAGAGDTVTPMFAFWGMAILNIVLALILPKLFWLGINGVWIALLVGMVFYGSVLAVLFKIKGPR